MRSKAVILEADGRRCAAWGGARVALLVLAGLVLAAADASAWWNTSWSHRRKLTFDNSGQPQNLNNFPILVVLNSGRIDYAKTKNDGSDLRFVDSDDGTLLDHEIEKWDEAGNSYVWVRVPQIPASASTDFIWMYYGNPAAAALPLANQRATWTGTYSIVQHFKEPTGAHLDSTINGNNSSVIDVQAQGDPSGKIDGADVLSAASTDNIDVPDNATLDMAAGDSFTVEAWIKTTSAGDQMIVSKEDGAAEYQLWTTGGVATFWLNDGVDNARIGAAGPTVDDGNWHYLVGRWSDASSTAEIFVDGVSQGAVIRPALDAMSTATPLVIGEEGDASRGFNFTGTIDEVRIRKSSLSTDDWIYAQFLTQSDSGAGLVGPFVTYGPEAAQCCGLVTTETATEIFVNGPNRFDMRFNVATGGGIDRFVDAEENTGVDLGGGIDFQEALFTVESGYLTEGYATGDNSEGVRLDLLEATAARVKVRQEASYARTGVSPRAIPGIKGFGDYSIYGIGRMATAWETRATVNTTVNYTQLQFSTYYTGGTPPIWTGYSTTFGPVVSPFTGERGPGADSFVMAQVEQAGARTDFLSIISQNWAPANNTFFGTWDAEDWEEVSWIDDDATNFLAGSRTRWNFLTYFKPTNLASNADAAVTSRANDYRAPGTTVVSTGSGWVDASENTAADPANVFFNEAEGAYVLEMNTASGLTFAMDGSATTRYQPFFKIRRWRSFVETPNVTFDPDGPGGAPAVTLLKDVDYRAAVKPFARAHRTGILSWHCSLQDATSCTTPDVGSGGSITGGTIVSGRFGNGLAIANSTDVIQASISDFANSAGAVEFWFRPTYDSTTLGANMLWWNRGATAPYDCYRFEHTGGNLLFQVRVDAADGQDCSSGGASVATATATGANYSWSAHEWVHLRTEWNAGTGLRILVNGRLVASSGGYSTVGFQGGNTYFGSCSDIAALTCPGGGAARHADGIIDEPTIYEGLGGLGNPESLAHGGLTADATEYLSRSNLNSALITTPVAAGRKGTYLFFGADSKFSGINMTFQTLGIGASVGAGALVWEYWRDNGAGTEGWASLESIAGFSDGTNDFKQRGLVSWTPTDAALADWKPYSVNGGPELYYVRVYLGGAGSYTQTPVENVVKTDILLFQYCKSITAVSQTFSFAVPTTEVKLASFDATPGDSSVLLEWRTASELQNLGFHLYRSGAEGGPWTRLTPSLLPGLGSSAVGQSYSYRDAGLANGTRYFYRLEDVDAASKATSHGPISAVPQAGAADGGTSRDEPSSDRAKAASTECPAWVLSAYGSAVGSEPGARTLRCTRHGDPEYVSLGVVSRDARQATLELRTGGFYALHEASGAVRVFVPGFDFPQDDKAAALPIRRTLAEAVVGRRVELGGVRALELQAFRGLVPSALGKAEMQVGRDGTVRATRRQDNRATKLFPKGEVATLLPSLFQGDAKSAVVEIAPLRYDAQRRQLVLARRVLVRLLFTGRESGESGRGSVGRAPRTREKAVSGELQAHLYTSSHGLHAVTFDQLFPGQRRSVQTAELRLQRDGDAVAFHVEPAGGSFGPGGRLYFHADRSPASTDYTSEVAYELLRARDGVRMTVTSAAPGASAIAADSLATRSFETERYYQPGLLEAKDVWLWEAVSSGATRAVSFALAGLTGTGTAELAVELLGASESGNSVDHHVSVSVNGVLVGEAQFAGKKPYRMSLSLPASLLREGANELSLTNVGDTGVTSLVFLDRFSLVHPQASSAAGGRFAGRWSQSGSVTVSGLSGAPALVELGVSPMAPRWLSGYAAVGGAVSFHAEAARTYLVVTEPLSPRVQRPVPTTLRATANQADYLVIAPQAFLGAAEPLVSRRQDQGLATRAVAFEEIAAEFGHGRPSAEAIRSFVAYAFHTWSRPSPRYVLLFGDASYDPRNFSGVSQPSPLPALWTKTSYLWTASDPLLGAVNGEDPLPDLAIGRLPATTLEQAEALVAKLLAWEDSGQGLSGAAALVADNPDIAGDFEADVTDIRASFLADRQTSVLKLSELGASTRPAIQQALDGGLSYLGYVGHGGAAVWASENVWNTWDAPNLLAQSRQPLLLTMNCLNGYFVAPSYESLSESLVKAQGRGAIAAFSPSGLSLDGPAHQYHRALMAELTKGTHQRLGDAVLAAQKAYAETGLMPELLGIYHLLGDPAMRLR